MTTRFARLWEPGRIGSMELRNRIALCPMGVLFGNGDGSVSDNEAAYYEARARGGAGLLIQGTACVAYPRGANHERMPAVSDDRYLPGMTMLADRVHRHGAKLAAQLNFMGVYAFVDLAAGRKRLVPYELPQGTPDRISRMVTPEETRLTMRPFTEPGAEFGFEIADEDSIAWVIDRFAEAADRCRRAGYDGVEIHAGHGYFIDEFLTPRNTRTDRWGGSIENRARLLVEVIGAIRARVGDEYPVWMRINAVERHHVVGESFDEQCRAIELAVAAGIDAVHVTAYGNTDVAVAPTDSYAPHVVGPLSDYAAAVRELVDVPVITFGRFEPDEAEQVLAEGKADFVAFGRKLLADPELPNKLAQDRVDDIRPCIYQYRCIGNIALREPARCVANPQTGREHDLPIEPAAVTRSVLVVGGGPAGLESARLLSERGHRVVLREASSRLGGTLVAAAAADPILDRYLGWLLRQVEQAGVTIELGAPVSAGALPAGVDEVVLALGGAWGGPTVDGDGTVLPLADLDGWLHDDGPLVGPRVVLLGHSKPVLSIADLCLRRGRQVVIVGAERWVAASMGQPGRAALVASLEARGAEVITSATTDRVTPTTVEITTRAGARSLPADTVIGIEPRSIAHPLAEQLRAVGIPVHEVGDGRALAFLEGATDDALHVARAIG